MTRTNAVGRGPDQGDHAGGQVNQPKQQVIEDRPAGPAGEGPRGLQPRVQERVDREQDDESKDRDAGPGDREDPDDDGENAEQDQ